MLNLRANLIRNDGTQHLANVLKNNTVRHNAFIYLLYIFDVANALQMNRIREVCS